LATLKSKPSAWWSNASSKPAASRAELLVVGDGPVELREGGRHNALRLGVASNELCRCGLDLTKRSRLIRAGADLVISNFSQMDRLLPILGLS
jgi:hypothetical protein